MSQDKHTLRLILSVITGIVIAMVLSGVTHELLYLSTNFPAPHTPMFDREPLLISLVYHSIYAVLGAVVTAKIARNRARKAVYILGTKEAVLWLFGTVLLWKHAAPWYNITKALLGIPLALLGGWIYSYFCKKSETKLPNA